MDSKQILENILPTEIFALDLTRFGGHLIIT